jgi:hypothetical protein
MGSHCHMGLNPVLHRHPKREKTTANGTQEDTTLSSPVRYKVMFRQYDRENYLREIS